MTADETIDYLLHLGCWVEETEAGPVIRGVPDWHTMDDEHKAALKEHRASILAADLTRGVICEECRAEVHPHDDRDVIFDLCRKVECPWWHPHHTASSPGLADQRRFKEWARRQANKRAAEQIPQ